MSTITFDVNKNFIKINVSGGYNDIVTSIDVESGSGASLPTPPFNMTWWNATDFSDPADDPNVEIIRVTGVSTDTLTITRGVDGTAAQNHNASGKTYQIAITTAAAKLDAIQDAITADLPANIQDQFYTYAEDAEASDAYAVTLTPALASYADGQCFAFKANTANTGAATLNVNSLGAKDIKKAYNVDVADGDILAGQIIQVIYDADNDWFQLISPTAAAAGGFESFESTQQTITAAGSLTLAHGLSGAPDMVMVKLKCLTSEFNYSIGDEVFIEHFQMGGSTLVSRGCSIVPDSTNLNVRYGSQSNTFIQLDKTTGAINALTNSNWEAIFIAVKFNSIPASTVDENQLVKGWIHFDGTGTISISDSYNVSSIVDNATGDYTINWDTDFLNADYSCVGAQSGVSNGDTGVTILTYASGSVDVRTYQNSTLADDDDISVIAIGDQ